MFEKPKFFKTEKPNRSLEKNRMPSPSARDGLAKPQQLRWRKAEERKCNGAGERAQQLERMRKRNYCTRRESLFKEDTLARAPRRRRKSRPTRTEATQPMTRGPGPTSHTRWCAGLRVLRRRTATRSEPSPAVVRPFISAKNNNPVANTWAQARESYSLGLGSWVRRRRTAARARKANRRPR
jgi:hypothetical protein